MAVCALTMLDGMETEVTVAGGVLLLVLALVFAWLSTHVADRGDHILGTILTVGAHASLIGLGGHESYSGGSPSTDTPEQQTPPASQENKPDDGESGTERGEGEGTGEGAEGVRADLLLDIQSKQPQAGRLHTSDDEDDDDDEDEDDNEGQEEIKKITDHIQVLSSTVSPSPTTATSITSISVRLKFLNDTEELAVVEPQDTVGVLKSKYFSGREHQIKLIYQGQLLQDPKKTLFLPKHLTEQCDPLPHLPGHARGPSRGRGSAWGGSRSWVRGLGGIQGCWSSHKHQQPGSARVRGDTGRGVVLPHQLQAVLHGARDHLPRGSHCVL
ncbi:hypothetical protein OYC64_005887 [Pagothenia borchgrevinki]|uniref:Ubiquitin-like domain-containing protein n=1 Tax=Pagothenia borchgrevinki TaxID=8213 RepID=A0ABD2GID0_PAGBO